MPRTWFYSKNVRNECYPRIVLVLVLTFSLPAFAGTPDWLRQAARVQTASSPDDVAVVLLDEQITTVTSDGEIRSTYRKAFRILRPQGRKYGIVTVNFDSETQLSFLKGWSITANNGEYEVKEKDAVESSLSAETLYDDNRRKILQIPGADPGSVIGYEYQQKERSSVLQVVWPFQDEIPVGRARFELQLPGNWGYTAFWSHHPDVQPRTLGQAHWDWELSNVEPMKTEDEMPTWHAIAGHLGICLIPPSGFAGKSSGDWHDIGVWFSKLAAQSRLSTPQIAQKARELTQKEATPRAKVLALATYVQHQVRYVAIEIGIGGYQPHAAAEILKNSYGDCKDKVTVLSALLQAIGFESYYVLINSDRDVLAPKFPTMRSFDHIILAIRVPEDFDQGGIFATVKHPRLGSLLLFDPTSDITPLGYLPPSLQANNALLVTDEGGELIKTPLLVPSCNRVLREAVLQVEESGTLQATVHELRSGPRANTLRDLLLSAPKVERQKVFEKLVLSLHNDAVLTSASIGSMDPSETSFNVTYSFIVPGYAQRLGDVFLLPAMPLGRRENDLMEKGKRSHPIALDYAKSEGEIVDITLPSTLKVDEIPESVSYDYPFATYKATYTVEGNKVHYSRNLETKEVNIPVERLEDFKALFRNVLRDKRSYIVLKQNASK